MIIETGNSDWGRDNGNNTHAVNYPLNENSIVVDLGGCYGIWASQIIDRYNPHVILLEPIPALYSELQIKFADNPKVRILNYGISTTSRKDILYFNGDGTSKYVNTDLTPVEVDLITIQDLFSITGIPCVHLMQVNIEGEEYDLLDKMLEDNILQTIGYLQIQFHTYIENAVSRREAIQERLAESFTKIYDYPFVFEGWKNKLIAI